MRVLWGGLTHRSRGKGTSRTNFGILSVAIFLEHFSKRGGHGPADTSRTSEHTQFGQNPEPVGLLEQVGLLNVVISPEPVH